MSRPKYKTYSELLPVGTRVKVKAGFREGTDHDWNGHFGVIVNWLGGNSWAEIQMDKPKRGWPNPVAITAHNLSPQDTEEPRHE